MGEPLVRARVFISHNRSDRSQAHKIGKELLKAGHEIWLDSWEILPGDSLIEKISDGIIESSYLLVLLSKNSVQSPWVKKELEVALNRQLKDKGIKVIPCLLEDCDIPVFLEPIKYADFREKFAVGMEELHPAIKMVSLATMGRIKQDEDVWIHDHAIDYGFPKPETNENFFRVSIISHYAVEKFSVFFKFEAHASKLINQRYESYPPEFNVFKPVVFFRLFIDEMRRHINESGRDLSVLLDGPMLNQNEFSVLDTKKRPVATCSTYARRMGEVKDNLIVYYYGELVLRQLDEFVESLRKYARQDLVEEFRVWLAKNPMFK
ncbi:MAG: toll/interleukin-1 receptor domain-containing protein [Alphaproteobacteria bacterium]|nr:toll/interleukin-1 receptor domain-containing protein [Alphaproteobacteria bacterium]